MINNDWQSLGVGLLDKRARIVASNTARIDLSMWLRSEPYKPEVASSNATHCYISAIGDEGTD